MSRAKMNESMFRAIKILLNSGATYREITDSLGVSDYVIRTVRTSENFAEYKQSIAAHSAAGRQRMAEKQEKELQEKAAAEAAEKAKKERQAITAHIPPETLSEATVQRFTIKATNDMMEEMRKTNEFLKLISNKLAFIVDELTT